MTTQVSTIHPDRYTVETPIFDGPFDILLELIESAELDITSIALASVTDQYLAHIRSIQNQDPDEVSAFLVVAAKLIQIKSEALLPRPVIHQESEEDIGQDLARQLIIYRRFKQLAGWLNDREAAHLQTYLHIAPDVTVKGHLDLTGLTLIDLVTAAQSVYASQFDKPMLNSVVSIPLVTIREKIRAIIHQLKEHRHHTFHRMLDQPPVRIDVVVTFLAMLELIKRHVIITRQETLFSDIELEYIQDLNESEDFSLEFLE